MMCTMPPLQLWQPVAITVVVVELAGEDAAGVGGCGRRTRTVAREQEAAVAAAAGSRISALMTDPGP